MNWVITLLIGGFVGWVASLIMKTNARMGCIANVVVGVVGSMLGYWLAGNLGFVATGTIARFIVAVGGAALLIVILQAIGIMKKG